MDLEQIIALDQDHFMNVAGLRTPVCLSHGQGISVFGTDGREFMDLYGGIAVSALGHAHPALVKTISDQAGKLLHCTNNYYNEPQARLAERLNKLAGGGHKSFFCNSGAEANEAAIKLARAYFSKKDQPYKNEFVSMYHSFHGRTITTITATAQPKYQRYFTPLTPGFSYAEPNDIEALKQAVNENTCGVLLEVIQGESGIHPLQREYLHQVRQLCDEKEILLILDEVQTGIGRTGTMFAWQDTGIQPDIFTLAKALGGGVPIGAVCARDTVAAAFSPGDHGTTFGGNPLACAAALTVLDTIEKEGLLEHTRETGTYFISQLQELAHQTQGKIAEIRGKGLMIGIQLKEEWAVELKAALFEKGFLVGSVGTAILRVLPPLIIQKSDVDLFMQVLKACIASRL